MARFNICTTSVFIVSLAVLCCNLLQQCSAQTTVRPYKFGFTINEQQHRSEKRDERGIVMGEFGFITADGIYHVTVYATDEEGKFRILAMKSYPYESPPKMVEIIMSPKPAASNIVTTTVKPKQDLPRHNFYNEGCSGCFLNNADDEPKNKNAGDSSKTGIRPLSKTFSGSNSSKNNIPATKSGSGTSATGLNKPTTTSTNGKTPTNTNTKPSTNTFTNTRGPATASTSSKPSTPTYTKPKEATPPTYTNTKASTYPNPSSAASTPVGNVAGGFTNKDTNQSSSKQENKKTFAAKTPTGEMDIMDMIVKDVLPAVVGSQGVVAAKPTILSPSSRPNAFNPSGKAPGNTKKTPSNPIGSAAFGKGGNSNFNPKSGSSAVGGDGDLYRFKYILDYHGHTETGKRNGNKEGNFYAIGDDNVERTIEYVANENGYHPRITWRRLNEKDSRPAENTLKEYEFVWFSDN
ncbi:lethal (3) malignant blood neoplasm isoform X2 [Haematobia irritans]|uniref:lethal (3) malignant blood neoplasm isoform X2 n=1 Tax=Haematobia irritans TaxID=7368 RepID=UPI003F4F6255